MNQALRNDPTRPIREIENLFITLKDGTRLAARIWLPEDAEREPVPAILEYLPYRKRDGTAALDAEQHDAIGDAAIAAETDERVRLLYRCIDRLAPLDRALLLLHLDERSQREIAEILGLTETNVGTKLGRLKQRLRNDLRDA